MSFTVVCNSNNAYNTTDAANVQYAFDWSIFEDGPYKVHLKFASQSLVAVSDTLYTVSIPDLGANLNSYVAGASTTATSSPIVALLSVVYLVDSTAVNESYLTGESTFCIGNRPRNTVFTVQIKNINGSLLASNTDYIMTLFFEKM